MSKAKSILVAAGEGKRFGSNKSLAFLKGKTILDRCLETFNGHPGISEIVLVLQEDMSKDWIMNKYSKVQAIAVGGRRRQDSVFSGFQKLDPASTEFVLVHDVARPLVQADLIDRVITAAEEQGAAVPVLPISDTLKRVVGDRISQTVDRKDVYRVQTPQGFAYDILRRAFEKNMERMDAYTDEASLVEVSGQDVFVVPGDPKNIKITLPHDIKIAETFLED